MIKDKAFEGYISRPDCIPQHYPIGKCVKLSDAENEIKEIFELLENGMIEYTKNPEWLMIPKVTFNFHKQKHLGK